MKEKCVYSDGRYTLGKQDDCCYLVANGERYGLTCHPYEPCLYITDESGAMTAVHNAFDPSSVLHAFACGELVTSITGREYDALDFCRMVEYAAGRYNVQIDEAERVFGDTPKKKHPTPEKEQKAPEKEQKAPLAHRPVPRPEAGYIIEEDPFLDLIEEYPDCVIDFCLVANEELGRGRNAHWFALLWAVRRLFVEDDDEAIWRFDVAKADGRPIDAAALFAPIDENGALNYRRAFLRPPYPVAYTDADFDRVNAALFPQGTDDLEVYEWTTDWSDYFDEGHEWWGTLCLTVYDRALDRFAVILASATD